ncbi:hypothetical protein SETIT_5G077600v2 [Setaria italica]|uniref:Uncharacterized protein n=1 Tax=Setaria italica TaxID=4555 RepID=A0A368R2C3_SETIT|nr:hypothetical protein SETIT_5G077600v2 [Setaria italica]
MTDAILVWSGKLFTNLIINGFSWRSSTVSHDRGSDLKAHAGWSTADEQLNKQQTYKVQSFSSKQQWQTLILRFAICFQQFDSEYTGSKVLGAGSQHCHPPGDGFLLTLGYVWSEGMENRGTKENAGIEFVCNGKTETRKT